MILLNNVSNIVGGGGGGGQPNFKNRTLCEGDNLHFLRSINSKTIDLIATDPPFQKGKDFHATPDSLAAGSSFQDRWTWDNSIEGLWHKTLLDKGDENVAHVIEGSRKSYGDDMGAFLCFMAVRLIECRRILKDTGSIYLHCDPTASHYLKELMDAVFGKENFRNEIVWCYTGPSNTKKWFPKKHDIILYYVKSDDSLFNRDNVLVPYDKKSVARFSKQYKESKGASSIFKNSHDLEHIQGLFKAGKCPEDWWSDITPVGRLKKELTGYPTQKPLALYERIIKASSNKGDFVLDPFCGCATTCMAAERLERKWIGIDLWDKAHECVIQRLHDEGKLAKPGQVRQDILFTEGEITYVNEPFERTDDMMEGAPYMPHKMKKFDDSKRKKNPYSREEMIEMILDRDGKLCQGCGLDVPIWLYELDHIRPRAEGGSDFVENRILLCGSCNKIKSNTMTLGGLRKELVKVGKMINERALKLLKDL